MYLVAYNRAQDALMQTPPAAMRDKVQNVLNLIRPAVQADGGDIEFVDVSAKTRDGLEIPSYYFLPPNYQPGQKLPTVVHIHGGPMVRADTTSSPQTSCSRSVTPMSPFMRAGSRIGAPLILPLSFRNAITDPKRERCSRDRM